MIFFAKTFCNTSCLWNLKNLSESVSAIVIITNKNEGNKAVENIPLLSKFSLSKLTQFTDEKSWWLMLLRLNLFAEPILLLEKILKNFIKCYKARWLLKKNRRRSKKNFSLQQQNNHARLCAVFCTQLQGVHF